MSDWITSDVVTTICTYMNNRQPSSVLEIVRRHAEPGAVTAKLENITSEEAIFCIDGRRIVTVKWSMPLESRDQIRDELVQLSVS